MDIDKLKKILTHIAIWFFPSTTPIYIITHDYLGYGLLTAYLVACAIPCVVAYPLEKWVMERKQYKRKITARRNHEL